METFSNPNPIKDYYIAYFDILGYRQFFKEQPEMVGNLLNEIHTAIINTKETLDSLKDVDIFNLAGINFDFKVKIFSDNVIICLERSEKNYLECVADNYFERLRVLVLLDMISTIQRNFIVRHKLFLRGGVIIGEISFNDDYVFGKGLIEAVNVEEHTVYPRIEISNSLYDFINKTISYSEEEFNIAVEIEKDIKNSVDVSQEDKLFYERISMLYQPEHFLHGVIYNRVYFYRDGKASLSYLYDINVNEYFKPEYIEEIYNRIKQLSPNTYTKLSSMKSDYLYINDIFKIHKGYIVEKINTYGNYDDIDLKNLAEATQREHILKNMLLQ